MTMETVEIVAPALVAGLLVAFAHAPLGIEVLRRGIVFIDLAIAQIVGFVIVALALIGYEGSWIGVQAASAAAAVVAALFFRWVERVLPDEQEAVIGCCYVLAASAALLALDKHPHGGDEMTRLLSGQILLASWADIAMAAPVLAGVGVVWLAAPRLRQGAAFFILFALAVTAAVRLVGVYVVFSSLILPALAVNTLDGPRLGMAWTSAGAAVAGGILVSGLLDLPAGPVLVVAFAVSALAFRLALSRRRRFA
ncbi:MAG: metal ABC transporter permease [Alphaproteobacteria bacterium]|nr:metal ABC transporter permease [Alphaproteobacteria bacterium]